MRGSGRSERLRAGPQVGGLEAQGRRDRVEPLRAEGAPAGQLPVELALVDAEVAGHFDEATREARQTQFADLGEAREDRGVLWRLWTLGGHSAVNITWTVTGRHAQRAAPSGGISATATRMAASSVSVPV